jgi:hypothetical protein
LLIWAVQNRVGIDLGGRPPRGAFTAAGKHWLEERVGSPARDDVHGIDVYEHVEGLVFVALNAEASVGKAASTFIEQVSTGIASQLMLTAKQELAAEILSASYFDASERSRFVTLISAVEALLELQPRPPEVENLVEIIKQIVRGASVQDSTRTSMLSSLEWLKKESIGQAGRALADRLLAGKTYVGKEPSRFFTFCYEVRSSILHNGKAPDEVDDLLRICNVAQTFVGDLLVASFAEAG